MTGYCRLDQHQYEVPYLRTLVQYHSTYLHVLGMQLEKEKASIHLIMVRVGGSCHFFGVRSAAGMTASSPGRVPL